MNAQTKIEAATLASAMAAAFGEIEAATKASENPAFKQAGRAIKYADITSVIEAIKPALIKHGLFFTQHPEPSDRGVCVETMLHHCGGQSMSLGKLFVPANKNDAQGFGSALTYARRYALVTAFGVPVEDDDGNAAAKAQAGANQGRSLESAVSPDGPGDYKFPDGPAKNITALKAEARRLWREIEGCGDDGELNGLLYTDETKAVIKQLSELEHPEHRKIWEGDGGDNPGISGLITRKQNEYAQRMVDYVRAG